MDMVRILFRGETPNLLILSVNHKLLIGGEADGEKGSLGASAEPFLSHKHNASIFPCFPLKVNGEDSIEVYRRIQRP